VKREGGAAYTALTAQLATHTAEIAVDLETIRLQNELERVDREWQMERQQYLSTNKDGSTSEPSTDGGRATIVIGVVVGLGFAVVPGAAAGPMGLFGLVFAGIAVITGLSQTNKGREFEEKRTAYHVQRRALAAELEQRQAPR
jgi:hypothetical protein